MEEKLFKELSRKERMDEMLVHVNQMLRRIHPDRGLAVNFLKMTDDDLRSFSDWDRKRFGLHTMVASNELDNINLADERAHAMQIISAMRTVGWWIITKGLFFGGDGK